MKSRIILACTVVLLGACNKVKDTNPQAANVPAQVVQLVKEQYENASNLTFSEIVKDKIWQADFDTPQKKIAAAVNTSNVISSYRLAGDQAPDSLSALLQSFVIKGGTFSNFKEEEYTWYKEGNYGKTFVADYAWNGGKYLFQWGVTMLSGTATYNLEMAPAISKVTSLSQQDLPPAILQYLSQRGVAFERYTVYKNTQEQNTYSVYVSKNNKYFTLLFNNDNILVAGFEDLTFVDNISSLPENIKNYLASTPEYNDFVVAGQFAHLYKSTYDGVTSYDIVIQKNTGTYAGTQVWFITLDQQANVILRNYLALY